MDHPHIVHNYYFGSAGRRKCPCGSNLQSYFWGVYQARIFHSIKLFCMKDFEKNVREHLLIQQKAAGCTINIKGFNGELLPQFLLELKSLLSGNPQEFLPIMEANDDKRFNILSNSSKALLKRPISFLGQSKNLLLFEM